MPKRGTASSDHEVIQPTNDLRRKVREVPLRSPDDDPVRRAEAALNALSRHFEDWMEAEVSLVAESRDRWAAAGLSAGEPREAFFRAVHDVKGQATTLGYPLAARAAASLCLLIERTSPEAPPPLALIDSHVEGIRAIFREGARDPADRVGSALVEALDRITAAHVAEHGLPEPDDGPSPF